MLISPSFDISLAVKIETLDLSELDLTETDRKKDESLKIILRDYRLKPITDSNEAKLRDSLDEAMTYFQLMELALRSGYITMNIELREKLRARLIEFVWSPAVRNFLRLYGYFSVGRLCDLLDMRHEYPVVKLDNARVSTIGYAAFLAAHLQVQTSPFVDVWLHMLDDYIIEGVSAKKGLKSLLTALANDSKPIPTPDKVVLEVLSGLEEFLNILFELFVSAEQSDRLAYRIVLLLLAR